MNAVDNQYKYIITDRLGVVEVAPLGEGDFVISHEQEDEGKYFYSKAFQGKITFTGAAFQRLKIIEGSIYLCTSQRMQVIRVCGGTETVIFDGTFKLTEGNWDLDQCRVTLKFEKQKPDECFDTNKTVKVNLLQEIWNRIVVKTSTPNGTIEYKNCFSNSNQPLPNDYWCGTGDPYAQNWTLVSYSVSSPDGVHNNVNNRWARELITLAAGETPEAGWVLVSGNTWAKGVTTINCTFSSDPEDENGSYSYSMNCDIAGYSGTSTTIDNGMHLTDVLNVFKTKFCPSLTVVSDFFQINPQNPSSVNYVTGLASEVMNLILFQKSDVKRPNVSGNAWKAEWTFEKLMQALNFMFNVYYVVENGTLRIEHISWFTRTQGLNLTLPKYAKYVKGMRKYSYDLDKIPKQEIWRYKEQWSSGDDGVIDYSNACTGNNKDNTTNYTLDEIMTDVSYALNNSESDSNKVDDLGFVMIATRHVGGQYYIISSGRINSSLFWEKLVPNYHYYNRPVNAGKFNGVDVTFHSTKPFKKGEKLSVPIECGEVFDANNTILTALGTGIVDKADFNLRTCMVELQLKYDVFTGLVNNQPPVIVGSSTLQTYKNTPLVFPINVTDPDGVVTSVQVVNQPTNGIVEILSTTQARFTPNNNYEGTTYFQLRAYDNWAQESNIGGYAVTVLPANQPPVAGNDQYFVFHGYAFTASPSIFANDSDDYGFTLTTPNVVTAQGVAVSINPTTGIFSYTPPTGFEGNDSFQYTIQDNQGLQSTGTVTLTVGYKNRPIAVNDSYSTMKNTQLVTDGTAGKQYLWANDYTPDGLTYTYTCNVENKATSAGGNVQINANGTFTYTPPANYEGVDTFTYTVGNGNGFSTATVTITVMPTIYVKLIRNATHQTNVEIQCGEPPMTQSCGFSWTGDYTVYFYSDAAGTVPYNVTGLNFKVNIKEGVSVNGGAYSYYTWDTSVLSGTSVKILDDYIYQDVWCDCYGGNGYSDRTLALAAGSYIIIT